MLTTKTALITGGSSGLGYEFAKLFAANKYNLLIVGRDPEKLTKAKHELESSFEITVQTIAKDLSKPSSPQEIFNLLKHDGIQIDALVNNAGFAHYGNFNQLSIKDSLSEIDVNVRALTEMTKLFLPQMIENRSGKILNVASTAAFSPGPMMSVYFATKAYVLSFTQGLDEELRKTGVTASVLCPGPTDTGFAKFANIQKSHLYTNNPMLADLVARIGFEGLMKNKKVIIPGLYNNLFVNLLRIVPRSLAPKVMKHLWNIK